MAKTSKSSGPFVVAYGAEEYLLDLVLTQGKSLKNRQVQVVDGATSSDENLVSLLEQVTLDDTPRVVVIDNAHKIKSPKQLLAYVDEKDPADASVFIFAVVRSDKLPPVWQAAAKKGRLSHFPKFKPWESSKKEDRIKAEASRLGVEIADDIPSLLLRFIGDDLRRASNELSKLRLLVGGRAVTAQDLARVISPDPPVMFWDVANAATAKDSRKAMNALSQLYKLHGENVAVPVTAALAKQVEKLLIIRQMTDKGDPLTVIAARLETHTFPLQKEFLPRAKKFTLSELLDHMKRLCELDLLIKGPALSKRTRVELAVLSIAS